MSLWDTISNSVTDSLSGAVDTVTTGAEEYLGNVVGDWTKREDPARPETVAPEPSPLPYVGPQQEQQQQMAQAAGDMGQIGVIALAVVAGLLVMSKL